MLTTHRGHEINVSREESMAGDEMIYYSIMRWSDGYECASGFYPGDETEEQFMEVMKRRVDNELASPDPWCEKEDANAYADFRSEASR